MSWALASVIYAAANSIINGTIAFLELRQNEKQNDLWSCDAIDISITWFHQHWCQNHVSTFLVIWHHWHMCWNQKTLMAALIEMRESMICSAMWHHWHWCDMMLTSIVSGTIAIYWVKMIEMRCNMTSWDTIGNNSSIMWFHLHCQWYHIVQDNKNEVQQDLFNYVLLLTWVSYDTNVIVKALDTDAKTSTSTGRKVI